MKRFIRENSSALLLLLLLVAVTSIATYWQLRQETDYPPLATASPDPQGARALLLWSEALEYETIVETPRAFAPPEQATLSLVLEPQVPGISDTEWQVLEEWVQGGGTLIVTGDGLGTAISMRHVDFDLLFEPDLEDEVVRADERILSGTPDVLANAQPQAILQTERTDHTVLLTANGDPVAVALHEGAGMVILTTLRYALSNEGLKQPGNPELALSLLSQARPPATIWFDEWHHGVRPADAGAGVGLGQWLRTAPAGQAILYTFGVTFVWLLLSGRRFGRPVPLKSSRARRAPAEHARALANLSRRAGHKEAVREYYRHRLKTQLGYRYGLSAAIPDEAYLERLESARPNLDSDRLSALLHELSREDLSDAQLLRLSQEVNQWTT